jgi:hypothetical protein
MVYTCAFQAASENIRIANVTRIAPARIPEIQWFFAVNTPAVMGNTSIVGNIVFFGAGAAWLIDDVPSEAGNKCSRVYVIP